MKRHNLFIWTTILSFILLGCSADSSVIDLPTIMQLPSATPITQTATERPTARPYHTVQSSVDTAVPPATIDPADVSSPTATPEASETIPATWTAIVQGTSTVTIVPTAEGDAVVIGQSGVNLRLGPSTSFEPPVALLEEGTPLIVTARLADNSWLGVQTMDGERGWVYADLVEVQASVDLASIEVFDYQSPTPRPSPTVEYVEADVATIPVAGQSPINTAPTYYSISSRTRQIFQRGQGMGNRATFYTKVGDSITANQAFMHGYGNGEYNLGDKGYLQETINFFSASHNHGSLAAASAFNAAAVLSAVWADDNLCNPNEVPLMCEYRLRKPSVAIIMLGSVDVQLYSVEEFESYMNTIVSLSIENGVIPVLTTFPAEPSYYGDKVGPFNNVIATIASREQIPLIDLRSVAMGMPDYGVGSDRFHLSQRDDAYINLAGEQNQYGLTMRNYLTLEMLDSLRRGIPMG